MEFQPSKFNVEIYGTEPYIIGGHTAAGYWVDENRRTTLKNLYAAGDVAGGCPQKYVTGAFAEAEIVAEQIFETLNAIKMPAQIDFDASEFEKYLGNDSEFEIDDLEVAMQTTMDENSGGLTQNYRFNELQLNLAAKNIERIENLTKKSSHRRYVLPFENLRVAGASYGGKSIDRTPKSASGNTFGGLFTVFGLS